MNDNHVFYTIHNTHVTYRTENGGSGSVPYGPQQSLMTYGHVLDYLDIALGPTSKEYRDERTSKITT